MQFNEDSWIWMDYSVQRPSYMMDGSYWEDFGWTMMVVGEPKCDATTGGMTRSRWSPISRKAELYKVGRIVWYCEPPRYHHCPRHTSVLPNDVFVTFCTTLYCKVWNIMSGLRKLKPATTTGWLIGIALWGAIFSQSQINLCGINCTGGYTLTINYSRGAKAIYWALVGKSMKTARGVPTDLN